MLEKLAGLYILTYARQCTPSRMIQLNHGCNALDREVWVYPGFPTNFSKNSVIEKLSEYPWTFPGAVWAGGGLVWSTGGM